LTISASEGSILFGVQLLFVYSIGQGLPFFATSLTLNSFLHHLPSVTRHMRIITSASGVVLIVLGILLLTDRFADLSNWFQAIGLGWDIDPETLYKK